MFDIFKGIALIPHLYSYHEGCEALYSYLNGLLLGFIGALLNRVVGYRGLFSWVLVFQFRGLKVCRRLFEISLLSLFELLFGGSDLF